MSETKRHSGEPHRHHDDPHNHKHTGKPDVLKLSDRFFEPVDRQIVEWLKLAPGSKALDAGCGGGGFTRLLAEAVGASGLVVGLDANPELLEYGKSAVNGTNLEERIKFQEGNVLGLPFEDGEFDLVWCSRVIHGLPDQLAGVRELSRVLRPGGRLVIREAGLAAQFLPLDLGIGAPGLEGRLQVAKSQWFANWRNSLPDVVPYPFGWAYMLGEAGLKQVIPKSFLHEFTSPLEAYQKQYLQDNLRGEFIDPQGKNLVSDQDVETVAQLSNPTSPHYVFDRNDLHAILVETIFVGHR